MEIRRKSAEKTGPLGADDGNLPIVLLACLAVGASLWRGYMAATFLPWGLDEFATWGGALNHDYADMLRWQHHLTHPPLYYMMAKACIQLTGLQDMSVLRLPSLLFSALSVPAAYWLGRALWGRWTALAFSAMVAVSPYLVHQAHNARMYSGHVFLTLVTLAVMAHICLRPRSLSYHWAVFGALLAALFWMSSTGIFLIAAVCLGLPLGWLLSRGTPCVPGGEARFEARAFAGRCGIAAVVFLILISPALIKFASYYAAHHRLPVGGEFQENLWASLKRAGPLLGWGAAAAVAASLAGFVWEGRDKPILGSVLSLMLIIGIAVPLWQARIPARYMLTAHVSVLMGLLCLVNRVFAARRGLRVAAAFLLAALIGLGNLRGPYADTRTAARLLRMKPLIERDSRIYITPWWTQIAYDYYGVETIRSRDLILTDEGLFSLRAQDGEFALLFAQPPGDEAGKREFERFLLTLGRYYQVDLPRQRIESWITSDAYLTFRFRLGSVEMFEYP